MTELRYSPAALHDLSDIWDYTEENWARAQAVSYLRDIERKCAAILSGTAASQTAEHIRKGYRKVPIGSHVIFFRNQPFGIEVVRILHQRMDVKSQL